VGEAVDDCLGQAGIGEDLGPLAEGEIGGHHQRATLVAFGDHLEDQLRRSLGQGQVAELVQDDELGACVAPHDPPQLTPTLGFLQLVGETSKRREAHPPSLLAGTDRQCRRQHRLAGAGLPDEDHRLAIVDPRALGECGDRRLGNMLTPTEFEDLHQKESS
jgi:hypothetical protein